MEKQKITKTRTRSEVLEDYLIVIKHIQKLTYDEKKPAKLSLTTILSELNVKTELGVVARMVDLKYLKVIQHNGSKMYVWCADKTHEPDLDDARIIVDATHARPSKLKKGQVAPIVPPPITTPIKGSLDSDDEILKMHREQGNIPKKIEDAHKEVYMKAVERVIPGTAFEVEHLRFIPKFEVLGDVIINDDAKYHDVDFVQFKELPDALIVKVMRTIGGSNIHIGSVEVSKDDFVLHMEFHEGDDPILNIYTK